MDSEQSEPPQQTTTDEMLYEMLDELSLLDMDIEIPTWGELEIQSVRDELHSTLDEVHATLDEVRRWCGGAADKHQVEAPSVRGEVYATLGEVRRLLGVVNDKFKLYNMYHVSL